MSTFTLTNSAADIDSALQKVVAVNTTPLDGSLNMVTSGGVKAYVDTADTALEAQILALESQLANTTTGVSLERAAAFSTTSTSYQTVPLSVVGQPDYFTNNGNNTFTLLPGNYLMWFSTFWKTGWAGINMELRLNTLNGMSDFSGMGVFKDTSYQRDTYLNNITHLLDAKFRAVNQATTFNLQLRSTYAGSSYRASIKEAVLTIIKV
tara:strand:- start:715 stop:1338 length:624 start_codon:yes stop_codon:yes gene_type:complete